VQDYDADFLQRGKQIYYSYKVHIGVDVSSGIICKGSFNAASIHDSQEFDKLLCGDEAVVFADIDYVNSSKKRTLRRKGVYWGEPLRIAKRSVTSRRVG